MKTRRPTKTQEQLKERVISTVIEARKELLAAASAIGDDHSREVFLGEWSLLDLLAHLTGWDEANVEAMGEVMAGQLPSFYAFHSLDWRLYNARLVKKFRRDRLSDQMALAQDSHLRVIEAVRSIPADAVNRDFGVRFRGYHVTVRRIMEAEAKDNIVHLTQIQDFKRRLEGGG